MPRFTTFRARLYFQEEPPKLVDRKIIGGRPFKEFNMHGLRWVLHGVSKLGVAFYRSREIRDGEIGWR